MEAVAVKTKKAFLTSGEVAQMLGCSSYWVNILINKGQLATHRIGGSGWHRIPVKSLEEYAEKHNVDLDWGLLH